MNLFKKIHVVSYSYVDVDEDIHIIGVLAFHQRSAPTRKEVEFCILEEDPLAANIQIIAYSKLTKKEYNNLFK